ncbi:MAG: 50S ribosomal protein L16 [Spirochaetes bacterium]|nr:50S ribosomal protein L16 [Spirochaetota bacterium]
MLAPNKQKYRKQQRGRNRGEATRNTKIAFGEYALVAIENGYFTANQLEAGRVCLTRKIKGNGKIWIKVFPDVPYTKKPAETRMGKGKGAVEYYVARVKRGNIIYEIAGNFSEELAFEALKEASYKMPVKCKIIKRDILTGV